MPTTACAWGHDRDAAAALIWHFLRHFDCLSIGTNDLIQYAWRLTAPTNRWPLPATNCTRRLLRLVADTIAAWRAAGQGRQRQCGGWRATPTSARLLLGLSLRSFSMHPSQVLAVNGNPCAPTPDEELQAWAQAVLDNGRPAELVR